MESYHSPTIMWCTIFLLGVLQTTAVSCAEDVRQSGTYCVKTRNYACPEWCEECQTLDWFVANKSNYFKSNTKMFFTSGEHYLSSSGVPVSVTQVTNFTLEGYETMNFDPNDDCPALNSRVNCNYTNSGLFFLNSTELTIRRLAFINCGVNVTFMPDNFTVHAAISFRTSHNVTLSQVLITNSTGIGLHVDRVYDFFFINNSAFTSSNPLRKNVLGRNAHFSYWDNSGGTKSSLVIENSSFKNGTNQVEHKNYPDGSGLSVIINASLITVSIRKINASFNHAPNGANVAITIIGFSKDTSTIYIHDSFIGHGFGMRGAGLMCCIQRKQHEHHRPEYGMIRYHNNSYQEHTVLFVSKTEFYGNEAESGGALYIHQFQQELRSNDFTVQKMSFVGTTFKNNTQKSSGRGSAVAIIKYEILEIYAHGVPQFSVNFMNCKFTQNHCKSPSVNASESSVMALLYTEKVLIKNSNFIQNNATALSLISSNVILKGNITFERNRASYGGAIKLCDSSTIYLSPKTYIKFVRNFAQFAGGAIYAEQRCTNIKPPCFYQPVMEPSKISHLNATIQLEFIHNTAVIAGKALYGGSVDICFTITHFLGENENNTVFDMISDLSQQPGPSRVTSDPYGVCFCNYSTNDSFCSQKNIYVNVYPGEYFVVFASAVGQLNGVVPSRILLKNEDQADNVTSVNVSFVTEYSSQILCHKAEITVCTTRPSVIVVFSVEEINLAVESGSYHDLVKPKIHVFLKMCPWIFVLKKNKCDCPFLLWNNSVHCDINTVSFSHSKSWVWIGCEQTNNLTKGSTESLSSVSCGKVIYSERCFKEYCVKFNGNTVFSHSNLSAQCNEGREGRICGACKSNYSLSLGIPKCLPNSKCSTLMTVLLFIMFLVSGLLLVFFLTFLNITVSDGTLHGMLFYANFVHVNSTLLFSESSVEEVLRIFVAWLNLDFGFEVCFYAGMDAYQSTWLEFVFLLYMFVLGLLIIYASHKYVRVTRLVGRNVVNVLSTIMLFSYSKLVHTSVQALSFTYMYFEVHNSSKMQTKVVWREDANVNYLRGKHIPLAIVAIILSTITLFYTLSLLFIQCLQRRSNWFFLRWVVKLKPFFDANTGPCRDSHRFWPGFLLFSRFLFYCAITYIRTKLENHLYFILGVCLFIFISACISPHGVYKKWPLNILEFAFVLNLGILSGLKIALKGVPSIALTAPSVGMFAMMFFFILLYHCFKRVRGSRRWQNLIFLIPKKRQRQSDSIVGINVNSVTRSEIGVLDEHTPINRPNHPSMIDFREPLLADD